jgi:hypothetical protein
MYICLHNLKLILQWPVSSLHSCDFRRVSKINFVFVCPSAWKTSTPTGKIFIKFYIWEFLEFYFRKCKFNLNLTRIAIILLYYWLHKNLTLCFRANRLTSDYNLYHFNFYETTLTKTGSYMKTAYCFNTRSHFTVYNSLKMARSGRNM